MRLPSIYHNRYMVTFRYDNVMAFFAGNEVMNQVNTTKSAPYMKAMIRDLKAYMKTKKRYIPIGYATNDDHLIRLDIRDYLMCGDLNARIDFFGINIYSWCGSSATYESSGYKERTEEYKDFDIPVMIGETGCNLVRPRPFTEIPVIYGKEMRSYFAGAVFYELTEETNEYGLVDNRNGSLVKLQDYYNFQKQIQNVTIEVRIYISSTINV